MIPDFSLDRTENPHPRMLAGALARRRRARWWRPRRRRDWLQYRAAMCDATGEPEAAMEAWLDRHE